MKDKTTKYDYYWNINTKKLNTLPMNNIYHSISINENIHEKIKGKYIFNEMDRKKVK